MGYTSREGMLALILDKLTAFAEQPKEFDLESNVPYNLNYPKGSPMSKVITNRIKEFYYGNQEPSQDNEYLTLLVSNNVIYYCMIRHMCFIHSFIPILYF